MVKRANKRLCHKESPEECAACFPERTARVLLAAQALYPEALRGREPFRRAIRVSAPAVYRLGNSAAHITVIENGQPHFEDSRQMAGSRASHNRFGFFGQINEFKGVDILLQAMHIMKPEVRRSIQVEIHGANLELQEQSYQELIEKLRTPLLVEGSLRWVGPYEPHELERRIAKVDWVVIPSIWWENSPMVIQEAFCARRPVVASGIGGMAEKVRHNIDGLHFEARSPLDLADTLTAAATSPNLWERFVSNIRQPLSYDDCAAQHLDLVPWFRKGRTMLEERNSRLPSLK